MSTVRAKPDVAVIGGGYAGLIAASRVVRGGRSVILVDPKPMFVHRLKLHRRLAGYEAATLPWSTVLPHGVERIEGRALAWDGGTLAVQTGDGELHLRPRRVLLATGSRSRRLDPNPLVVDLEDPGAPANLAGRHCVVVAGGGATGLETAFALAASGREVTLLANGFPGWSHVAQDRIRQLLQQRGIRHVQGWLGEIGDDAVHVRDGGPLPCDAVVPCLGFTTSPVARDWGLPTDAAGRVRVSSTLRVDDVTYAAGDAVTMPSMPWLRGGAASAMPLGAHAAACVLADLAGEEPRPFRFGWTMKALDLVGWRALLQRLEPDGTPTHTATLGAGPMAYKSVVFALAPRLGRWETTMGRDLYAWHAGPAGAPGEPRVIGSCR